MKVLYTRVSTLEQNTDRQLIEGVKTYSDKVSGTVPFSERPEAKKLLKAIDEGKVTEVIIHSIDRLGRNTLDILQTIQDLTSKGVNVISKKEGFNTLLEDGTENPVAKMMISILATLSEFELNRSKERRLEGIAEAKKRGNYKSNGGKPKESLEQFLNKASNRKCYNYIKKEKRSLREASKLSDISYGTAAKISKMIKEGY